METYCVELVAEVGEDCIQRATRGQTGIDDCGLECRSTAFVLRNRDLQRREILGKVMKEAFDASELQSSETA
jgi:hypothetical protein